jgi:hypothetical protein
MSTGHEQGGLSPIPSAPGPGAGNTKTQLLWSLYLSERDFIKHHEIQRTTASNILAAVAAGLIVASGNIETSPVEGLIIPVLLMGIGWFGFLFCGKLYSLLKLHAARSYEYLEMLGREHPELEIIRVKGKVDAENKKAYPFFSGLRLNRVWSLFHLLIFASGAIFFFIALGEAAPQWTSTVSDLWDRALMLLPK